MSPAAYASALRGRSVDGKGKGREEVAGVDLEKMRKDEEMECNVRRAPKKGRRAAAQPASAEDVRGLKLPRNFLLLLHRKLLTATDAAGLRSMAFMLKRQTLHAVDTLRIDCALRKRRLLAGSVAVYRFHKPTQLSTSSVVKKRPVPAPQNGLLPVQPMA